MGFGTVGLGQQIERNGTAVFSRTDRSTTDNQSEDPRLHRHLLSILCNSLLLSRLPKGRGIVGIFLSTKPAYMLCTAGKFSGLKPRR